MHKKYLNKILLELQNTNSAAKTSCCVVFDLALRYKHCSTATDSAIGLDDFDFRGCLSYKMSCSNAKELINWHTGWLGKKDANEDLLGDWAQYFWQGTFKCQYCNLERKYSNGGRSSLIQHSHFKIMNTLRNLALLLLRWSASLRTTLLSCRKLPGCWLKLISRARKSNAAYKEDLRKAAEEEKERLATREREKEKAAEVNTEKWERAR